MSVIFCEVVAQLGERGSVTAKEAGSKPVNLAAKCENISYKERFFHTCETQIKGWVPKWFKGGSLQSSYAWVRFPPQPLAMQRSSIVEHQADNLGGVSAILTVATMWG